MTRPAYTAGAGAAALGAFTFFTAVCREEQGSKQMNQLAFRVCMSIRTCRSPGHTAKYGKKCRHLTFLTAFFTVLGLAAFAALGLGAALTFLTPAGFLVAAFTFLTAQTGGQEGQGRQCLRPAERTTMQAHASMEA